MIKIEENICNSTTISQYMNPYIIYDSGKHFELTNNESLTITIDSSQTITIILQSTPNSIIMNIDKITDKEINTTIGTTSSELTIKGLIPSTLYHKYEDSFKNHDTFTTDEYGSYSYTQDLSIDRLIFIQLNPSTILLGDTGWSGTPISADWDPLTKTGTLQQNINELIEITSSDITLNGNGYYIAGSTTPLNISISINQKSNITIKNLTIKNSNIPIYISNSNSIIIMDNKIISSRTSGCSGISLTNSNNNQIINNEINSSVPNSNSNTALLFTNSSYNSIITNKIINYGGGIDLQANSNNNNITSNKLYNNRFGILLTSNNYNKIIYNEIFSKPTNYTFGIMIYNLVNFSVIKCNTFAYNVTGIRIGLAPLFTNNNDNKVYNNNFLNNSDQAINASGSSNVFNLESLVGGNFWSNHISSDPYTVKGVIDDLPWVLQDGWNVTGVDDIKRKVASIENILNHPYFGLNKIDTDVLSINNSFDNLNYGLQSITDEISSINNLSNIINTNTSIIKSDVSSIKSIVAPNTITTGSVIKDKDANSLVITILNSNNLTKTIRLCIFNLKSSSADRTPIYSKNLIIGGKNSNTILLPSPPLNYELRFIGLLSGIFAWAGTRKEGTDSPLEESTFTNINTFTAYTNS